MEYAELFQACSLIPKPKIFYGKDTLLKLDKHDEAQRQIEELVKKVLNKDAELLSRLQDLPYLKEEFKIKDTSFLQPQKTQHKCHNCQKELSKEKNFFCSERCKWELKQYEIKSLKETKWEFHHRIEQFNICDEKELVNYYECSDCKWMGQDCFPTASYAIPTKTVDEYSHCPRCEENHWKECLERKQQQTQYFSYTEIPPKGNN